MLKYIILRFILFINFDQNSIKLSLNVPFFAFLNFLTTAVHRRRNNSQDYDLFFLSAVRISKWNAIPKGEVLNYKKLSLICRIILLVTINYTNER